MPRYGEWMDPPAEVRINTTLDLQEVISASTGNFSLDNPPTGMDILGAAWGSRSASYIMYAHCIFDNPGLAPNALIRTFSDAVTGVHPDSTPGFTPDYSDPDAVGFEVEPGTDPPFSLSLLVTGSVERFISHPDLGWAYPGRLLVVPADAITPPPGSAFATAVSFGVYDVWETVLDLPTSAPDAPTHIVPFEFTLPYDVGRFALMPLMVPGTDPPFGRPVGSISLVAASVQVVVTHHARWRFVYTGGHHLTRQRQSLSGTDSWPLRQRQNGGYGGSWPLRQRQRGL